MRIVNYDILTDTSAAKLWTRVKEAMRGGWQPLGGVSVSLSTTRDDIYAQAVVIYEK